MIVPGRLKCFGILGREENVVIPWNKIEIIGCDVTISVSDPSDNTDMSVTFNQAEYPFATYSSGVLNLFFTEEGRVLVDFWSITITTGGAERAAFMLVRILMLVTSTFLLTYTTSPISLTDGLESLMNPLKVIKVPVHELSMMMCIALRFIPTLIEETDKIMSAQKARGADFETGNIFRRAKALVPILVPLFISAFRRADELATAMECRCYHGGEGRTALRVLRYKAADWLVLAAFLALTAGIIVLKKLGF